MDTSIKMEHQMSGSPAGSAPTNSTPEPSSLTPAASVGTKASQSPSPKSVASGHTSTSNNPKRPPRKSTLTQQQKNQKRQRATQDQLTTLELEFNKNPTPTATVRERIADEINMTERSVQIWFQNRRAKIKLLAKKSLESGEDIDSIPESMRTYLAMQAMEPGKALGAPYMGRTGLMPYGSMMLGGEPGAQGKVLIHHLTCRSLSIGKWTRVGQNTMDLIVFYSPDKCTMTYYINNDQAGYKIEYHFSAIKNIFVENPEGEEGKHGGIVIELNRAPSFFMDNSNSNGFVQVGDFTEDLQASHCFMHHLGGNPKVLSGQLAKLVSLESFANRHNPHQFDMNHSLSVSAPVSPTNRPSSQPNFAQPHIGMFQESQWAINPMHHGMRPPGHKRQRSRSVPSAVDFSMFQNPMPSFYIQHPGENHGHPHNPNIYAPVPQPPPQGLGAGSHLRIDTQATYGMDMRPYPLSATTAPSDYASPNYFSQASEGTPLPVHTPYSGNFLSPMPQIQPPASPLSYGSQHGDPAIVEQSPPMGMMQRSASADIYPIGESAISDDGHGLDMYSKHTLNLPLHPHSPAYAEPSQAELDMNQLVQFDDPSSLSPDHMGHQ
ncbi:homeobox domain-containing protein [Poronia punctata]|nr:homeobox domain-containing protein [Poronia punctata]